MKKLDLLHVHYAIPHASAAFMAQKILESQGIKIPFITTLHGTDITLVGKDPSFEPVITFSINHSNAVTAVSNSLKNDTKDLFKITKDIEVIPNFICVKEYQLPNNEKYKKRLSPNDEFIITHVSNFRKVKRIEDVVKVFEIITKKVSAKLVLVGDGPERNKIERLCRAKLDNSAYTFLGNLKSTIEILNISDVFILPSEKESFGLAALEAMASSVPVISTCSGGIPEVIENGKSGYLSKIGDVDDMAKNMLKILSSNETLKMFKEKAFERAKDFDIETVLPLYEELYNKTIKIT